MERYISRQEHGDEFHEHLHHRTWTDGTNGYIKTSPLNGSFEFTTLTKIVATPTPVPNAIALDQLNVYWTDTGTLKVMKVPLAGGNHVALASNVTSTGLAVEGTHVYWTDSVLGTVSSLPRKGGAPTTLVSRLERSDDARPATPRRSSCLARPGRRRRALCATRGRDGHDARDRSGGSRRDRDGRDERVLDGAGDGEHDGDGDEAHAFN